MAGINRLIAIIDDGPSLVAPEMQVQGIEAALTSSLRQEIDLVMMKFDGIDNTEDLFRVLHDRGATHLVCYRLATIRSLVPTFWDLTQLIADLRGFDIEFISVKEGIRTEDEVGLFLRNLAIGWKNSRSMYKSENARVSQMKARAKGSRLGRRKTRDDEAIIRMRKAGASIREIAIKTGSSSAAVQRALKDSGLKSVP